MSSFLLVRRWLARRALRRAQEILPPSHRLWGEAMRNEAESIEEGQRLSWAIGCLWASWVARIRTLEIAPGRLLLALVLLLPTANDLFATALTAAYRLSATRWAEGLGKFTPGDDYARLIPLMNAIPLWLHGLWLLAASCYVLALVRVLLCLRSPHIPVLCAIGIEVVSEQLGRPIVVSAGVAANPNPSTLAIVLPVVLSLTLAAMLWVSDRESRIRPAQPRLPQ